MCMCVCVCVGVCVYVCVWDLRPLTVRHRVLCQASTITGALWESGGEPNRQQGIVGIERQEDRQPDGRIQMPTESNMAPVPKEM